MKRNNKRKSENSLTQNFIQMIYILTLLIKLYHMIKRSGVVIDSFSFFKDIYTYTKQKWNKNVPAFLCLPSKRKKRSLFSTSPTKILQED
jgi:hypothetical protein